MDKLKILGWLYASVSALGLLIGIVLCVGFFFETDSRGIPALQFIAPLFIAIAAVTFVPGLIGGLGLIAGKIWARVPVVIASLTLLFLFPLGTALAAFAFWVLYDAERQSGAANPIASSATPQQATQISSAVRRELNNAGGVLLAAAGVGAGFLVAIGAGFRLNQQQAPSPIDGLFFPAIVVLVLVVGFALWHLIKAPASDRTLRRARFAVFERGKIAREREADAEARRQRVAHLAANPATRKYALLIENGEPWSDEQIAYDRDRSRIATCAHLVPIERAMREAGIDVRLTYVNNVRSPCLIDEPELAKRFAPLAPVRYLEYISGDRSLEDPPHAVLNCSLCNSTIRVIHRVEAGIQTPLFPPAGGATG